MPYIIKAPTWHNSARKGAFAKSVLMPGDPKRSKWIAENCLEDAKLVNDIRGVQGYTGLYKGKSVSVMASGMGIPSICIYARELYEAYDVENIIRIGTAGAIDPSLRLMDVVMAIACSTDSAIGAHFGFPGTLAPTASFDLALKAHEAAVRLGISLKTGSVYSSDSLYDDDIDYDDVMRKMHVLASDMESAGLYLESMRAGKNALSLLTIVADPVTGAASEPDERESALKGMVSIALETAICL